MPKTYAVSLSVEYVGEGIETRSDTKYEFVQAEDVPAADALADRLAAGIRGSVFAESAFSEIFG